MKTKGFIPVMLTPFTHNGEVDFYGLAKLTEFYIEAGAAGLFANCLSSEMFALTEDERIAVVKQVVKTAAGVVPVVATGTFGGSLHEQADFIKKIHSAGADAVILITGLLAAENEPNSILEENTFQLFQLTENIPLGFYECPEPYKRIIGPEQLGRFVASGRIKYHKDTSLDIAGVKEKLARTRRMDFGLYDAYMPHAVESLKAGSAGLSCIQGNYFPELVVWLCRHFNDADLAEEVQTVASFFMENMELMHNAYPPAAKFYLQNQGFPISTFSRVKTSRFDIKEREDIKALARRFGQLKSRLEIAV